jgi:hypothetical protein
VTLNSTLHSSHYKLIYEVIIMENKDKSKKTKKKFKLKGRKEVIVSDVNGSYTGVPTDPMDIRPVQDADDL